MFKPSSFPMRAIISQGSKTVPLADMAHIERRPSQFIEVDFGPAVTQALGSEDPFRGRNWVLFGLMFDPNDKSPEFLTNTSFFKKKFQKNEFRFRAKVWGPAVSIFLAPLEDADIGSALRQGEGTVKSLAAIAQSTSVFERLSKMLKTLEGVEPLDLNTNIADELLAESGLKLEPGASLLDVMAKIKDITAKLNEGELSRFVEDQVEHLALGALAGLVQGLPLAQIKLALKVFTALDGIAHAHDFRFYNLVPEIPPQQELADAGYQLLKIKDGDLERIRFDANNEGNGGLDLRHILAYHYRALPSLPKKVGFLPAGERFSLCLLTEGEEPDGLIVPTLKVQGDTYEFAPSLSVASCRFSEPWQLEVGPEIDERVLLSVKEDGRLVMSGLSALLEGRDAVHSCRLFAHVGFETLKSKAFNIHKLPVATSVS